MASNTVYDRLLASDKVLREVGNTQMAQFVGFTTEQTANLMIGKPLTYSGELYSEEHKRKIKVKDTVPTVETDKGKLVLAVGKQHIGDWLKE